MGKIEESAAITHQEIADWLKAQNTLELDPVPEPPLSWQSKVATANRQRRELHAEVKSLHVALQDANQKMADMRVAIAKLPELRALARQGAVWAKLCRQGGARSSNEMRNAEDYISRVRKMVDDA